MNYNEQKMAETFYNLCTTESKSIEIKKTFMKLDYRDYLTDHLLSYGILGAVIGSRNEYIPIIDNFMKKNEKTFNLNSFEEIMFFMFDNNIINEKIFKDILINNIYELEIKEDLTNLQTIFNFLSTHNPDLSITLNNKYSIVSKSLEENIGELINLNEGAQSSFCELKENGTLEINGCFGGAMDKNEINKMLYSKNPIIYNFINFNPKLLDLFFEQEENINSNIIKNIMVRSVFFKDEKVITYLFNNTKCRDIINQSEDLKLFINSDQDFPQNKDLTRSLLKLIDVKENLTKKTKI